MISKSFGSLEELSEAASDLIAKKAAMAIAVHGMFSLALAGGSTPKRTYELLAQHTGINWNKTHVFWSDERDVPAEDPHSNYKMAYDALLSKVAIPEDNIHRVRTELGAQKAAVDYTEQLEKFFGGKGGKAVFDLVLLGMGDDGHTASLFPGTVAVNETEPKVVANYVPKFSALRITFTLPLINDARSVLMLVSGPDKAEMLQRVLAGPDPTLPASLVKLPRKSPTKTPNEFNFYLIGR